MENNYTTKGFAHLIKITETKILNTRSRIHELEIELSMLREWIEVMEKNRMNLINDAEERGYELDPKEFLME